jgi:hypothetical protein
MRVQKVIRAGALALFVTGGAMSVVAQDGTEAQADARQPASGTTDPAADKPVAGAVAAIDYQPLTGKERWDLYWRRSFYTPGVILRAAGPALGAHLNNEPPQWGQGAEGYSKRFANRFARFTLQATYESAGAAMLGHEVRYIRSKRSGFFPRAAHALAANFATYDRNGRLAPHYARVGGMFAAEFTASRWMPEGYRDARTAMRGAGVELGVGSAFNLIREFAPELKRVLLRRK